MKNLAWYADCGSFALINVWSRQAWSTADDHASTPVSARYAESANHDRVYWPRGKSRSTNFPITKILFSWTTPRQMIVIKEAHRAGDLGDNVIIFTLLIMTYKCGNRRQVRSICEWFERVLMYIFSRLHFVHETIAKCEVGVEVSEAWMESTIIKTPSCARAVEYSFERPRRI